MAGSEAQMRFDAGNTYAAAGDHAQAAAAFGDCVVLAPAHPGALRNWGNALRAAGQGEAAIAAFRRYLALALSS